MPPITSRTDLKQIVEERFTSSDLVQFGEPLLDFVDYFANIQVRIPLTIISLVTAFF